MKRKLFSPPSYGMCLLGGIVLIGFVIHGCIVAPPRQVSPPLPPRTGQTGIKLASAFNDKQCNICHSVQFHSFADGHPDFPPKFPYTRRNANRFDHSSHINKYFKKRNVKRKAPKDCMGCHSYIPSQKADKGIFAKQNFAAIEFDKSCAKCHAKNISRGSLALIRSSSETPTPVIKFLLELNDDPEENKKTLQELVQIMSQEGSAPLVDLLKKRIPETRVNELLSGLDSGLVKAASQSWKTNQKYEPKEKAAKNAWSVDGMELRYIPSGHPDPMAKRWVEFAVDMANKELEEGDKQRAVALRNTFISRGRGLGYCTKCHAVSSFKGDDGKERLKVEWKRPPKEGEPVTVFSHIYHIDKSKKDKGCTSCHKVKRRTNYLTAFKDFDPAKFTSNFNYIKRDQCLKCHGAGEVKQNCTQCHINHRLRDIQKLRTTFTNLD